MNSSKSKYPVVLGLIILVSAVVALAQQEKAYPFVGANGRYPTGGLVADENGNLYGTTGEGGAHDSGIVYEMSPPVLPSGKWTETVLYSFASGADGSYPNGSLIFDQSGKLYGTTGGGGSANAGTVFELSPPSSPGTAWAETVLYGFQGVGDGANPSAGLIFDVRGRFL